MPKNNDRNADTAANLEPCSCNAPLGAEAITRHDSPCRIVIHSLRNRLADPDGISGKAVVDGIVHAGILPDDTTKQISEVAYSQQKTKGPEKTVVTIERGEYESSQRTVVNNY